MSYLWFVFRKVKEKFEVDFDLSLFFSRVENEFRSNADRNRIA